MGSGNKRRWSGVRDTCSGSSTLNPRPLEDIVHNGSRPRRLVSGDDVASDFYVNAGLMAEGVGSRRNGLAQGSSLGYLGPEEGLFPCFPSTVRTIHNPHSSASAHTRISQPKHGCQDASQSQPYSCRIGGPSDVHCNPPRVGEKRTALPSRMMRPFSQTGRRFGLCRTTTDSRFSSQEQV